MSLESLENSIQKFHNSVESLRSSIQESQNNEEIESQSNDGFDSKYENVNNSPYNSVDNFGFEQLDVNGSCVSLNKADNHANRHLYTNMSPNTYFRISDNNDSIFYTKNGHFTINENGEVLTDQGYHLTGYNIKGCRDVPGFISNTFPKNLNLTNAYVIEKKPTTRLALFASLNMNAPVFDNNTYDGDNVSTCSSKVQTVIYNKDGKECLVDLTLLKTGDREWTVSTSIHDENQPISNDESRIYEKDGFVEGNDGKTIDCDEFKFQCDEDGNVIDADQLVNITSKDSRYEIPLAINLKNLRIHDIDTPRDCAFVKANGFPEGTLNKFVVDNRGIVTGYYSNHKKLQLAQMSFLEVNNPDVLETVPQEIYSVSKNNDENGNSQDCGYYQNFTDETTTDIPLNQNQDSTIEDIMESNLSKNIIALISG